MNSIFLVYNDENSVDDDDVVAVFTDRELASAFTERHPRFYGCYRIEEKELNPFFEKTEKWLYLVIIGKEDNCLQIHSTNSFKDEVSAFHNPISKYDDEFYMHVFARDKNDALLIAQARFEEMNANGEWLLMKDDADIGDIE